MAITQDSSSLIDHFLASQSRRQAKNNAERALDQVPSALFAIALKQAESLGRHALCRFLDRLAYLYELYPDVDVNLVAYQPAA